MLAQPRNRRRSHWRVAGGLRASDWMGAVEPARDARGGETRRERKGERESARRERGKRLDWTLDEKRGRRGRAFGWTERRRWVRTWETERVENRDDEGTGWVVMGIRSSVSRVFERFSRTEVTVASNLRVPNAESLWSLNSIVELRRKPFLTR